MLILVFKGIKHFNYKEVDEQRVLNICNELCAFPRKVSINKQTGTDKTIAQIDIYDNSILDDVSLSILKTMFKPDEFEIYSENDNIYNYGEEED